MLFRSGTMPFNFLFETETGTEENNALAPKPPNMSGSWRHGNEALRPFAPLRGPLSQRLSSQAARGFHKRDAASRSFWINICCVLGRLLLSSWNQPVLSPTNGSSIYGPTERQVPIVLAELVNSSVRHPRIRVYAVPNDGSTEDSGPSMRGM